MSRLRQPAEAALAGYGIRPARLVLLAQSELIWLQALAAETGLKVPEPVLTVVDVEGVPGPRICALFRWGSGGFFVAGLTPDHRRPAGGIAAGLSSVPVATERI